MRTGFVLLLNLVDELKRENAELRAENQRLREAPTMCGSTKRPTGRCRSC